MGAVQDRVASIFDAAVELENRAERTAYLDAACGPDLALRAEVEELLAHDGAAGGFLNISARLDPQVATAELSVREGPGTVIGCYKLMEQIGEGGMGLVFVAEQQHPVRRKVALKLIKPGMDTRQVIARFEAERQALALMEHPHIAKVLDGGETATGRPYFVMELVKGVPITEYCDRQQIPVRERLVLFLDVCHAVQHAHQKGIIHRDIKPPNVLVMSDDGTPLVKVIDFGVAKAMGQQLTDKTLYTQFAQLVGTPLYMSPEQAGQSGRDVDTRTDIYALGVLLYELLTGTTPFDQERLKEVNYDELRRIIREEEPPKPSTRISTLGKAATTVSMQRQSGPKQLSRLFRGELDWIVMKALEKDRNRRYETANGFAMDVQRYLEDEPVQACPPSAGYRLEKFVSRNKRLLASVGAIAASLLVGLAVTVVLLVTHAIEMQEEQKKTRAALGQVDRNLALALEALDNVYMEDVEDRILQDKRMTEGEQKSLQKGLQFYERFAQQNTAHEELQRQLAKAYRRAGFLRLDLDPEYWAEAQADFAKAIAVLEKWADESHGSVEDQVELARSCFGMAQELRSTGQYREAEPVCRRAIALFKKLSADPQVPEHRNKLRLCLIEMAKIMSSARQPEKAEEALREALRLVEGWMAEYPTELLSRGLGHTARQLYYLLPGDRIQEKFAVLQKAADVFAKLGAAHPDGSHFLHFEADTRRCLGDVLSTLKRYEEAEKAYRQAVDLFQKLPGGKFGPPHDHRNIQEEVLGYIALANFLIARNRTDDAATVLRQASALYEKFPNDPNNQLVLGLLRGRLHRQLGQWDQAIADYSKSIELDPTISELWTARYSQRGESYAETEHWKKAASDFAQAVKLEPEQAAYWYRHALVLLRQGDISGYRSVCAAGLAHFACMEKPREANWIAWTCALVPGAVDDWKSPLRLAEQASRGDTKRALCSTALGAVLYRAGRIEEAIQELEKSTKMVEAAGADAMEAFPTDPWFFLAMAYQGRGNREQSRRCLTRTIEFANRENKNQPSWNRKLTLELLRREASGAIGAAEKK
jgi:serine/threonine protein kinase/tetratricopeptide (TPR) repeat protein